MNIKMGGDLSADERRKIMTNREAYNAVINGEVNLAELQRLTGITRGKLRRLRKNRFEQKRIGQ